MRKVIVPLSSLLAILVILACGGAGDQLGAVLTAPAVPSGVSGAPGAGQAQLSWNASNGATHYNVKRSTISGGPYTIVANPPVPSFTDTGLTNGTPYFYVVSSENLAGESSNSAQVTVTPATVPGPVDVSINANFAPVTIQAKAGQVVRWTNNDFAAHSVTNDFAGGPDSEAAHPGGMAAGMVYSWTVPAAAVVGRKYFYHCRFHGAAGNGVSLGLGMAGVVQVIP